MISAIYGAALKYSEIEKGKADPASARNLLKNIQRRVRVMDKSGRESFTTFEKGIGDAIVTYENEVLRAIQQGARYEIVYPRATILIRNPVAVVDGNVNKHGNRDVVEAFVNFLFTPNVQKIFADAGFRPVDPVVAATYKEKYPTPELLFGIEYLGGWKRVMDGIFGPNGVWTGVLEELAGMR